MTDNNNIIIDDIQIEVIKKKNIKNLNLSVYPPDGKVKITVPIKMNEETIKKLISSKLPWIRKQQAKIREIEWQPERKYVSGESHYFLGKAYLLNVIYANKKQRVEIIKSQINLYVREGSTEEERKKVMIEWYRNELKKHIPGLIKKWEDKMGVSVNSWGVKLMKTRWGTCNPKAKRIWINLELAKKSFACLEYIVVHEMVHLLERYHNKRFYDLMGHFMPNWKEIKKELLVFEN